MRALDQIDGWDVPTAAAAVFDATGVVDRHGTTSRRFRLASVSKVLTAITVHVAIEEGSISLDDGAGPADSTVRHLLAHASGLAPDGEAQVLGPPANRRIYSNTGFEVLADHVASATGIDFADYSDAALIQTLALEATDVSGSPAHGHHSSADDLCAILHAVVSDALLAPATVEALTTPAFPDLAGVLPGYGKQGPNPWGLGVEVRGNKHPHWTSPDNGPRTWGHFGQSGTFVWWDPDAGGGLGLVALTDRDFGAWAVDAWPPLATAVLAEHT